MMKKLLVTTVASCGLGFAQSPFKVIDGDTVCPITRSVYPVDVRARQLPLNRQPRFEIRTCQKQTVEEVQLLGFAEHETKPSLRLKTGAYLLGFTVQEGNVLVVTALDGASTSNVIILQFQNGRPLVVAQQHGDGIMSVVEQFEGTSQYLVIKIGLQIHAPVSPQKTGSALTKEYRVKVDN